MKNTLKLLMLLFAISCVAQKQIEVDKNLQDQFVIKEGVISLAIPKTFDIVYYRINSFSSITLLESSGNSIGGTYRFYSEWIVDGVSVFQDITEVATALESFGVFKYAPLSNTSSESGLYTETDRIKLTNIESGAQVNPTATEIVSSINNELGTEWQTGGSDKITTESGLISSISTDNQYPAVVTSDIDLGTGNIDLTTYSNPRLIFGGGYIRGDIIGDFTYDIEFLRENKSIIDNEGAICSFSGVYNVDLEFWGIDEDTTPLETTQALNRLFKWAKQTPALTDIIFPNGYDFYLDVEQDTIITRNSSAFYSSNQYPHHFAIIIDSLTNVDINLNECSFTMVPNAFTRYQNIYLLDCENVTLSNGIIIGDRVGHDYDTNPIGDGSYAHEHGLGILGEGLNNGVTLKNLTIKRAMGYGVGFYFTEPYINSLFQAQINLDDIEEGTLDTYGAEQPDTKSTRTLMKVLPVGYSDIDHLTLAGLGFFSSNGITDRCVITVFWYDGTDTLISTATGDEGTRVKKPKNATKYRLLFAQPIIATKWFEGAIDNVTGLDIALSASQLATHGANNYGRTALTDFTDNELTDGFFNPYRLRSDNFFDYGKFTGDTVYFYNNSNAFISSSPYNTGAIAIPVTATQWRMFGRGTPYNTRADRFQIFLSPISNSQNIVIDNCFFEENRAMGGAGIYNGLTVKNSTFIRNGQPIQGRGKDTNLGYGWDLEEGHKINKKITFDNNRFIDNYEGSLLFYPLDDVTLTNNYFNDKRVVIHEKINKATLDNNTFENCIQGRIPLEFKNSNAKFINSRIDGEWGQISDAEFIDSYIQGATVANDFDAESLEIINIKDSEFTFTTNYSRNDFITTYAKTAVQLEGCKVTNDSGNNIYLINANESGSAFRLKTPIGLSLDDCDISNLILGTSTRISSITNSELDLKLAFNARIEDSQITRYQGLTLEDNNITFRPILGAFAKLSFGLDVNSNNNEIKVIGQPQGGYHMLEFEQGLESRQDVFEFPSTIAEDVFRTTGNTKIIRTEVRSQNPSGVIDIGGTVEEFEPLYVPSKVDISYAGITNIVIVGASIVEQRFGRDLTTPNAQATLRFKSNGLDVDVYGYGFSGEGLATTKDRLQDAYNAFPSDNTLFFFHGIGNNVSQTRPFATMTTAETTNLDDLFAQLDVIIAPREERTILLPTTFRRYGALGYETIFNDPSLGSLPYNQAYIEPRMSAINSKTYSAAGVSIFTTYEDIRDNRDTSFQTDGIHLVEEGYQVLEPAIISGLMELIDGVAPLDRVVVSMGSVASSSGFNKIAFTDVGLNSTAGSPIPLKYINGEDSGFTIKASTTATAYGTSGVETNTAGADYGASSFDNTLQNDLIYNSSIYAESAHTITWELEGMQPNTVYAISAIGSRVNATSRITQLDCNGTLISFETSFDPPASPVTENVLSDTNGVITIVQSASSGTYSYLGGLRIE